MTKSISMLIDKFCLRYKKPILDGTKLFYQILQEAVNSTTEQNAPKFDPSKELDLTACSPSSARAIATAYLGQYFTDPASLEPQEHGNPDRSAFLERLVCLIKRGDIQPLKGQIFHALQVLKIAHIEDTIEGFDEKARLARDDADLKSRFMAELNTYLNSPYPEVQDHAYERMRSFAAR